MFASALTFNPRSKATNIGYLLSLGAVFLLEMELLFHVGVIWGRRQENKAIWETKFQRIDTEIHKKNYYFYTLKQ